MSSDFPVLSLAERDRRWAALRAGMADNAFDCLIVFGLKGREHYEGYVANENIEGLAIFPRDSDPVLVSWHPKMVTRRMGSKLDPSRFWIKDTRIGNYGPILVEVLKERGLDRASVGVIGLEIGEAGSPEGIVPFTTWRKALDGLPAACFSDATWWFREVMLVKSEEELSVLRHCGMLGERACRAMIDAVKLGASEFSVFRAIQEEIHAGGAVMHDPFLIMTWGADDIGWAEPAWAYYGGPPRAVEPGDLIMAELFPAYGGLETQQQMSVAVEPVSPIVAELGDVAARCYDAGIAALRPGRKFSNVWDAMLQPLRDIDGWSLTPMIHSVAPLGWVGGMGFNLGRMPDQLKHFREAMRVEFGTRDLVLREGMSFAFEPNACKGQRRVNVGGTVVVTDGDPEELNTVPNRLRVVG
jgi:Xaa-Pro aminopeptidase